MDEVAVGGTWGAGQSAVSVQTYTRATRRSTAGERQGGGKETAGRGWGARKGGCWCARRKKVVS